LCNDALSLSAANFVFQEATALSIRASEQHAMQTPA